MIKFFLYNLQFSILVCPLLHVAILWRQLDFKMFCNGSENVLNSKGQLHINYIRILKNSIELTVIVCHFSFTLYSNFKKYKCPVSYVNFGHTCSHLQLYINYYNNVTKRQEDIAASPAGFCLIVCNFANGCHLSMKGVRRAYPAG